MAKLTLTIAASPRMQRKPLAPRVTPLSKLKQWFLLTYMTSKTQQTRNKMNGRLDLEHITDVIPWSDHIWSLSTPFRATLSTPVQNSVLFITELFSVRDLALAGYASIKNSKWPLKNTRDKGGCFHRGPNTQAQTQSTSASNMDGPGGRGEHIRLAVPQCRASRRPGKKPYRN